MQHPDVVIAGAGIIGLSIALELATSSNLNIAILDRSTPMSEASTAAAGMLASADPYNPPALFPLAELSAHLYPDWLFRLEQLSGLSVPFQTRQTLQLLSEPSPDPVSAAQLAGLLPSTRIDPATTLLLQENSIDPRQLAPALLRAVGVQPSIQLFPHTPVTHVNASSRGAITVESPSHRLSCSTFIDCTGAWLSPTGALASIKNPVFPRKGQMLSVAIPRDGTLQLTVRSEHLYIVPRILGPSTGRAVIGATVEDAGFDKQVHSHDIHDLRHRAATLLPFLEGAEMVESWAGIRPGTADQLPLLGPLPESPNHLIAAGHFRNGILLAPATARAITDLVLHQPPSLDLQPFSPLRFASLAHRI